MPETHGTIYLDFNATAPLRPEARVAMLDSMSEPGNPSSVHRAGRDARGRLEASRRAIAGALGAAPGNVVFTSGGTEADILAIRGSGRRHVLASAIEHQAVLSAAPDIELVPVTPHGLIDLEALDQRLSRFERPALVSVMWANNETGAIQPVREVVAVARKHGALVHSDAVQAVGKLSVDFAESGLDMMSVSAHKLGGPPGAGALLVSDDVALDPVAAGGGQERGRRPGTENLPGIAGFAAAVTAAAADLVARARVRRLRDAFEERVCAAAPRARVLCREVRRLDNTSCIAMHGVPAETQVMALDLDGIAVSAGAACSSGKVEPSHVIAAMDPDGTDARNAIRISLGWTTTEREIDRLVRSWLALYNRAAGRPGTAGA